MNSNKTHLQDWIKSDINIDDKFLQSTDKSILDRAARFKHAIMHEWERPIMELDAKMITKNGGRILNIGHGMGIIDGYIRGANPTHHTIVDIHPQIIERARAAGYQDVYEGDWVDFVKTCKLNNIKYDGIYFDTYCFNRQDWSLFVRHVDDILNTGGLFSYFNGGAAKSQQVKEYMTTLGWDFYEESISVNAILLKHEEEIPTNIEHTCICWTKP